MRPGRSDSLQRWLSRLPKRISLVAYAVPVEIVGDLFEFVNTLALLQAFLSRWRWSVSHYYPWSTEQIIVRSHTRLRCCRPLRQVALGCELHEGHTCPPNDCFSLCSDCPQKKTAIPRNIRLWRIAARTAYSCRVGMRATRIISSPLGQQLLHRQNYSSVVEALSRVHPHILFIRKLLMSATAFQGTWRWSDELHAWTSHTAMEQRVTSFESRSEQAKKLGLRAVLESSGSTQHPS